MIEMKTLHKSVNAFPRTKITRRTRIKSVARIEKGSVRDDDRDELLTLLELK